MKLHSFFVDREGNFSSHTRELGLKTRRAHSS